MGNRQAKEIKEYEYVVEHGDGSLEEWNGKPVIVKASSKGAAAKIVGARLGGGDWDVRRAGDEPRMRQSTYTPMLTIRSE